VSGIILIRDNVVKSLDPAAHTDKKTPKGVEG
jgi:hypothetical protein